MQIISCNAMLISLKVMQASHLGKALPSFLLCWCGAVSAPCSVPVSFAPGTLVRCMTVGACNGAEPFTLIHVIRPAVRCMENFGLRSGCGGPAICSHVAVRNMLCCASAGAALPCGAAGAAVL